MAITRQARTILIVLFFANSSNFYNRQIISVLAETIKGHFGLSDVQVGGLSAAFEFTYPIAALLLAVVADRWLRKRVIAGGVLLCSAATWLTGAAGSYWTLVLARLGVGLGQGGYGPAALATLSDAFPKIYRSRAVSYHDVGLLLGSAAGYGLGGLIGQALGWRASFFVAGLPGLLIAWLVWRLREPARGGEETTSSNPESATLADWSWVSLRRVFGVRTLWVVYGSGVLISLVGSGLIFWLPAFLQRVHGLDPGTVGVAVGGAQVVTGVGGILVGGWLADRWTAHHPGGRLLTIGLGFLLGAPCATVAILTDDLLLLGVTASLALFFYMFYFPCVAPQIHDVTPPSFRATAFAVSLFVSHFLGNLPSAPLIGWFSDRMGENLRAGLAFVPGLCVVVALIMMWGARFVEGDVRGMQARLGATDSKRDSGEFLESSL